MMAAEKANPRIGDLAMLSVPGNVWLVVDFDRATVTIARRNDKGRVIEAVVTRRNVHILRLKRPSHPQN